MLRFLSVSILAIALVAVFVSQPLADEQSQQTIVKVYKSPG